METDALLEVMDRLINSGLKKDETEILLAKLLEEMYPISYYEWLNTKKDNLDQ